MISIHHLFHEHKHIPHLHHALVRFRVLEYLEWCQPIKMNAISTQATRNKNGQPEPW